MSVLQTNGFSFSFRFRCYRKKIHSEIWQDENKLQKNEILQKRMLSIYMNQSYKKCMYSKDELCAIFIHCFSLLRLGIIPFFLHISQRNLKQSAQFIWRTIQKKILQLTIIKYKKWWAAKILTRRSHFLHTYIASAVLYWIWLHALMDLLRKNKGLANCKEFQQGACSSPL